MSWYAGLEVGDLFSVSFEHRHPITDKVVKGLPVQFVVTGFAGERLLVNPPIHSTDGPGMSEVEYSGASCNLGAMRAMQLHFGSEWARNWLNQYRQARERWNENQESSRTR